MSTQQIFDLITNSPSGALFSPCRVHRTVLWRTLSPTEEKHDWLIVVGVNPSTADESVNDATIRRCIRFGTEEGYIRLVMMNLISYRATNPKHLFEWLRGLQPRELTEAQTEHSRVRKSILEAATSFCIGDATVVCAWGAHAANPLLSYETTVLAEELDTTCLPTMCWGRTKAGHPRHPLYLPADTPLEPFAIPRS